MAAINTNTAAVTATFFTVYDPSAATPYDGGGIWDWGGATLDASQNVYIDAGNADATSTAPFAPAPQQDIAYAEHIVQLSPSLSVLGSALPPAPNYSTPLDMDFAGTPVTLQPLGCADQLVAATGKNGQYVIYDTTTLASAPLLAITIAPETANASSVTNAAYSASTGLLYVSITDTGTAYASGQPGMIAIGFSGCTPSVVWNQGTAFGLSSFTTGWNRSAPTVTSGGVVFVWAPVDAQGTGGLFALDASSGALLNGGQPVFTANSSARMGAVVDGDWIWLSDNDGDLYGLTIDPNEPMLRTRNTVRRHAPVERYTR
jgi:hypothetical protein